MENAEQNTFPVTIEDNGSPSVTHLGLTKREYFAGLAMQGLLSNSERIGTADRYAEISIEFADELLKQLEK